MGRVRITPPFVLLAQAALLAARIEASRTSVWGRNPPASLTTTRADAAGLLASVAPVVDADVEITEAPRFDLGDVVLVESDLEHEDRFGLGSRDLLGPAPAGPVAGDGRLVESMRENTMSRAAARAPKSSSPRALRRPEPGRPVPVHEGKSTVGFLIAPVDLMLFKRLVAEEEDRLDIAAARKALREPGSVSLEDLKAELGL